MLSQQPFAKDVTRGAVCYGTNCGFIARWLAWNCNWYKLLLCTTTAYWQSNI